jgi:hypothetical protein
VSGAVATSAATAEPSALTATSTGVRGSDTARGGACPTLMATALARFGASQAMTEPFADSAGR